MRGRRLPVVNLMVLVLVATMPLGAQRPAAPPAAASASATALPEIKYTRFSLPNGLRVVFHEDHSTPVVAVNVWYHVGSMNESAGRTGFAHLFEHMMFQGFQGYPYAFGATMDELGASRNGSTSTNRTNYYEVVPSNFLDTALFMEAGRMGRLLQSVTQERLDNQRDVVKNEKRQRIDNQPYGQAFYRITSALYPPEHPYSWPVIGSMEDLTAASLEDVSAFFRTYYAPNNASLVLAGDFDPVTARTLVEKHFGAIPTGGAVKRPQPAPPRLDREVREEMEDSVQLPRIYLAWHSTPRFSKAEAAVDLLSHILGGGKSSRLYKALQVDRQIVQDAVAGNPASELAGLFLVMATAKPGQTLGEVQRIIDEEITKLKTTPVTVEELGHAYVEYESQFIFGLQTVLGKAEQLNAYATFLDDPGYLGKDLARYRSVTAADVQQAARDYLTDKRVVLSVVPRRTPPAGTTAAPKPAGPVAGAAASQSAPPAAPAANPAPASQTGGPGQDGGFLLAAKGGSRSEADAAGRAASPAVQWAGRPGGRAP